MYNHVPYISISLYTGSKLIRNIIVITHADMGGKLHGRLHNGFPDLSDQVFKIMITNIMPVK